MTAYLQPSLSATLSLAQAVALALRAWAVGDRAQRQADEGRDQGDGKETAAAKATTNEAAVLSAHVLDSVAEKTIECAVLDRSQPGSSKYRALAPEELGRLLPTDLKSTRPR
jgi:proteasome alpha subunit